MTAIIYKPTKTAMQSGTQRTKDWVIEFLPKHGDFVEPIMGWTGSKNTQSNQVKLSFDTKEEAIEYANRNNIKFTIEDPKAAKRKIKAYTDNFKYHPPKEEISGL